MKMIKKLECKPWEERLKELDMFSLEKGRKGGEGRQDSNFQIFEWLPHREDKIVPPCYRG